MADFKWFDFVKDVLISPCIRQVKKRGQIFYKRPVLFEQSTTWKIKKSAGVIYLLFVSALVSAALAPVNLYGFDCAGHTYSNTRFETPELHFSPFDKIYIIITCKDLEEGEYTIHANWVHKKLGLIRSNKHDFVMDKRRDRVDSFWFKLMKKGPMASAFTNQDFYEKNFGEWIVEVYLNNEPVASSEFTIYQ